jgi:uncharacterized protein YaeQ
MALTATIHRWQVTLSDVDRQVYETLDLRLAQHPSETMRYLVTRTLAYCLSYEEGIAFSKGGLSDAEEPPVSVVDPTGVRTAWIDVGAPSAERLHRASKATPRVSIFTHADLAQLRREASSRAIHRVGEIAVFLLEPAFLDAVEARVDRNTKLELVRSDGRLYVTIGGATLEGALDRGSLVGPG